MKVFDTKVWVTTRLEEGVLTVRLHGGACYRHDDKTGEPKLAAKHFDVEPPEGLNKLLSEFLKSKEDALRAAGQQAAYEARKVAIDRREIEEVS